MCASPCYFWGNRWLRNIQASTSLFTSPLGNILTWRSIWKFVCTGVCMYYTQYTVYWSKCRPNGSSYKNKKVWKVFEWLRGIMCNLAFVRATIGPGGMRFKSRLGFTKFENLEAVYQFAKFLQTSLPSGNKRLSNNFATKRRWISRGGWQF